MNPEEYDHLHVAKSIHRDIKGTEAKVNSAVETLARLDKSNIELKRQIDDLRRAKLGQRSTPDQKRGQFVSEDCAKYLASIVVLGAARYNKLTLMSDGDREEIVRACAQAVGMETRAALTTSDIPLPQTFASEVVELVWMYGQARQYGTVIPIGSGSFKLGRLKTSPAFGFIDVSAQVPEKSPQIENVSFDPQKAGGIIRLPSEIDSDTIVPMGQFLARYIARESAKFEDVVFWTADGSATYKTIKGATKAALDLGKKVTLTTGNTAPDDITLANLRGLRSQVSSAARARAAYYMHASAESHLVTFNNSTNGQVYNADAPGGPRLDGYPVRWVDVLPEFNSDAAVDQLQLLFGDAAFMYLGERSGLRVETSNDVYFATDEIAVRALERFDCDLMADDALAVLQLAAS